MLCLIVSVLVVAAVASGQDCEHTSCNTGLIKYYKELNCLPVQESGACCPSRFDCTAALSNRVKSKCHVKGRAYEIGSRLTQEQVGNKCVAGCRCTVGLAIGDKSAHLNCANIECPEDMGDPQPPGCYYVYSHDKCCAVEVCKNTTKSTSFTCEHAEKSYQIGAKFYPKEKPCFQCICQQGYDGTLKEPWCQEITCGIEIHYGGKIRDGCVPIHYGANSCCPIGWRCPDASDTVVKSSPAASTRDTAECVFGNLRLKVSDKLKSEKACIECKCTLPPHVSCVQNGHC